MSYFPALLNLNYKKVVVVGGGQVARQKVQALVPTKAHIHIVSPDVTKELATIIDEQHHVTWHEKTFEPSDVDDAILIFATTDSEAVNDAVEESAQHWQQFTRADMKGRVDFINPAVVRRGDLLVSVSTSGASPGLTRKIKANLEQQFDARYDDYVQFLKQCRQQILTHITNPIEKRQALKQTLQPEILEWVLQGEQERCDAFLHALIGGERNV